MQTNKSFGNILSPRSNLTFQLQKIRRGKRDHTAGRVLVWNMVNLRSITSNPLGPLISTTHNY